MHIQEENKAIARRIITEVFCSSGNIANLGALAAPDILIHDTDKELRGLEQLRQGIAALHAAFPDLHYTIDDLLADGDKITARCQGAGTHHGPFRGIAATGKPMRYTVILIWRFAGGKLAEHWSVSDVYGMLQQLDVVQLKA